MKNYIVLQKTEGGDYIFATQGKAINLAKTQIDILIPDTVSYSLTNLQAQLADIQARIQAITDFNK